MPKDQGENERDPKEKLKEAIMKVAGALRQEAVSDDEKESRHRSNPGTKTNGKSVIDLEKDVLPIEWQGGPDRGKGGSTFWGYPGVQKGENIKKGGESSNTTSVRKHKIRGNQKESTQFIRR